MKSISGVEPPQNDCSCQLCTSLRAYGSEYSIEDADTLPPSTVPPIQERVLTLDEIRAELKGGEW